MSPSSYRYSYLIWIFVTLFVLIFGLFHWTGGRGGFIGAYWTKYTIRRHTWRPKRFQRLTEKAQKQGKGSAQPIALPSNAQFLALAALFVVPLLLCTVGPDYIAPGTSIWDYTRNMTRRDTGYMPNLNLNMWPRTPPAASTATTRQPEYTISKAWWTAGGRTGLIAFALLPLCVLFALKSPPFALFALPYPTQLHFDKLIGMHRWCGRLIYFVTVIHVVTWSVQLSHDHRRGGKGGTAWNYVLLYDKFVYAIVAFMCMTLLVLLSISPMRTHFYEIFYFLHMVLVPATIIFSALHFPPIWWWCWSALLIWVAERLYRLIRGAWINGSLIGISTPKPVNLTSGTYHPVHDKGHAMDNGQSIDAYEMDTVTMKSPYPPAPTSPALLPTRDLTISAFANEDLGDSYLPSRSHTSSPLDTPLRVHTPLPIASSLFRTLGLTPRAPKAPPIPGHARVELLPGRTLRLTILTARPLTWAPGQHVLLTVPTLSRFTSHPFTVASVCDHEAPPGGRHLVGDESGTRSGHGREIVLIVRAREGLTRDLWDEVRRLSTAAGTSASRNTSLYDPHGGRAATSESRTDVFLPVYVDGPFGSAVRARWSAHPTVLIICGGSGVAFGLPILEFLCLCLSGRKVESFGGKKAGGKKDFLTTRVRFVWLVREYSHLQWCASIIRRCVEMVPPEALQVDLFVTNFSYKAPSPLGHLLRTAEPSNLNQDPNLAPPAPRFARSSTVRSRASSIGSEDSNISSDSLAELIYSGGGRDPAKARKARDGKQPVSETYSDSEDGHILDLTNFDGEDDTRVSGEERLSLTLKREGKLRRAASRKQESALTEKMKLSKRMEGSSRHSEGSVTADVVFSSTSPRVSPIGEEPSGSADSSYFGARRERDNIPSHSHPFPSTESFTVTLPSPDPFLAPKSPTGTSDIHSPISQAHSPPPTAWHLDYGVASASPLRQQSPGPEGALRPSRLTMEDTLASHPDPTPLTPSTLHHGNFDARSFAMSDGMSLQDLLHTDGTGPDGHVDGLDLFNITETELNDLQFVSALARPGRPKLHRIVAEEVDRTLGNLAIACCGPVSLNCVVRKVVAAQVDPGRVRRENKGGIDFVSEDFAW